MFLNKSQDRLWQKVPTTFRVAKSQALLSDTFQKLNGKNRHILAFDDFLLLYKSTDDTHAKGMLRLTFDIKFELVRQLIERKQDQEPQLGQIVRLDLFNYDSNQSEITESSNPNNNSPDCKQVYSLIADDEILLKWRDFLIQRINHFGFHHMFRVYKKIGKGNFASVYQSERLEDKQLLAVKAFSKSVAFAEKNGRQALINEITLMRQLDHQNLVKLSEVYETTNSIYMCLELIEGGSLYDILKCHSILNQSNIKKILLSILQGLNYLHQKDIMHRDLKLENILFKRSNQYDSLVIADFGLATNTNDIPYLYSRCGTPGYVAPEVINIKDMQVGYSSVCDIYSVGLIFHLLLTGKAAFPGKTYTTVVKQNREALIDFNFKGFEKIDNKSFDLMKKMLENNPKLRITAEQALKHPYFSSERTPIQCKKDEFIAKSQELVSENRPSSLGKGLSIALSQVSSPQNHHHVTSIAGPSPSIIPSRLLKKQNQDENLKMRSPLLFDRTEQIKYETQQSTGCNSPALGISPTLAKASSQTYQHSLFRNTFKQLSNIQNNERRSSMQNVKFLQSPKHNHYFNVSQRFNVIMKQS